PPYLYAPELPPPRPRPLSSRHPALFARRPRRVAVDRELSKASATACTGFPRRISSLEYTSATRRSVMSVGPWRPASLISRAAAARRFLDSSPQALIATDRSSATGTRRMIVLLSGPPSLRSM